jgi:hypothetical protein
MSELPNEIQATNDVPIPLGERVTMTLTPMQGQPGGPVQIKGTVIKCEKDLGFWQMTLNDIEELNA